MGQMTNGIVILSESLIHGLRKMIDETPKRIAAALVQECEAIGADSDENFVPVDFGILKGSRLNSLPIWEENEVTVGISYGGAASAYALAVHEHPSEFDPPSWDKKGTASSSIRTPPVPDIVTFHPYDHGPKFLERAMLKAAPFIPDRIAARLRIIK